MSRALALPLALLALASGCARCGAGARAPVERVLPRGAVVVVVAPGAARLGERLKVLEPLKVLGFLAPTQGFADARAFTDALMSQLGVDLRSPAALEAAGLDPQGALGAAVLVSAQGVLAVPVKDGKKFQAALAALAQQRLGAGLVGEETVDGVLVRRFSQAAGSRPALGYVLAHGYALVASGAAVARLPGLATLSEADSLAADRELEAQRARAGRGVDLYAWAPAGSPALASLPVTSALVTAQLTAAGLVLELAGAWKPGATAAAALEPRPAEALAGSLPADAFLTARYRGDPALAAGPALALLGGGVGRALAEAGVDPATQLVSALRPGAVAALALADRPPLDRGLPTLDPRQANPFAYVQLSGVAALSSADAGVAALEQLAVVAPRLGAQLRRTDRAGAPAFLTTYAQGEGVHFAVRPDRLLFASPVARLDALLALDGGVSAVEGEGALAARLDVRRFTASVRALPESAWGLGGFALKATAVRWLEAVDDLQALELEVASKEGALRARLVLQLQLAAPQAGP
jgi:hypothetical protein